MHQHCPLGWPAGSSKSGLTFVVCLVGRSGNADGRHGVFWGVVSVPDNRLAVDHNASSSFHTLSPRTLLYSWVSLRRKTSMTTSTAAMHLKFPLPSVWWLINNCLSVSVSTVFLHPDRYMLCQPSGHSGEYTCDGPDGAGSHIFPFDLDQHLWRSLFPLVNFWYAQFAAKLPLFLAKIGVLF